MSHIKFIGGKRFTDLLGVKGVTAEMVAMEVKAETVEIAKVVEAVDR